MRQVLKRFSLLAATLVLSAACTKKNSNEIVVGHFGSMTGADATFGQSTDDGIRLAIDEANAAGGINGKQIKLVTMDTQGKSEEAAAVVTRLIEQHRVMAVLGEVASGRSLAAAPIARGRAYPEVTPAILPSSLTRVLPKHLRLLASNTCVGLRYGYLIN